MKLAAVVFPFDTYGSGGSGEGATLLADILHEAIADANSEDVESRISAYTQHLEIVEAEFHEPKDLAQWAKTGHELADTAISENDFTLWLSGNHLGVLPVIKCLKKTDLVIQLDAHFDCYNLPSTHDSLSHGNWLRGLSSKRPKFAHLFSRDLFLPVTEVQKHIDFIATADECMTNWRNLYSQLSGLTDHANRVWLDIDVDAFDPAFAPAVGHRQPFGMTPQQLLEIVALIPATKLIGCSISEFIPAKDRDDSTLNLLGWFVEWLLLRRSTQ
jgi:agmatinase